MEYITKLEPNQVEILVVKPMLNNQNLLDEDSSRILMTLLMVTDEKDIDEMAKDLDKLTNLRLMLESRLKSDVYQFSFSKSLQIFTALSSLSPGNIVMMLACYQYYVFNHPEKKDTELTLNDFVNLFPFGIPNNNKLNEIWDSQKVSIEGIRSDNLLDIKYPYNSITL